MTDKGKFVLSEEVAEEKMNLLLDFYDFELDPLSEDQQDIAQTAIKKLKLAIRKGRLEIAEDSSTAHVKITQKLAHPPGDITELNYKIITGAAKAVIKTNQTAYSRLHALAGYLTGIGEAGIKRLIGRDMSLAEELTALFLLL